MKNCMVTAIGAANPFRFTLKMKLTVLLGFLAILGLQANTSYAQSTRLSLDMENATVQNVISTIESQTEFTFFFNSKLVNLNRKLTIKAQKKKIDKVLSLLFEGEEIIYEIDNRKIILKAKDAKKTPILGLGVATPEQMEVTGTVTDDEGYPLYGANIIEKGSSNGTITDEEGKFTITVATDAVLAISYIGFAPQEVPVAGQVNLSIALQPDAAQLDAVNIVGIRAAQERALAIKKLSATFVDAIAATDVGKLPDQNVAEALQRVTGVAIQRSRGEGDFVSIRGLGPDFVRGTINGRSLLSASESVDPIFNGNLVGSTGRAANFDILPSEIINTLEVVKSNSAKHVEGGIGGIVNLKTARPIRMGNKVAGSLTGTYRDLNGAFDPAVSGFGSWANEDKTFGVLGSVSYSRRTLREDISRTFGHFALNTVSTDLDTNNDGTGDIAGEAVPFPLSNNANGIEQVRDRLTLTGTLEWKFQNSGLTVDLMYSRRNNEEEQQNLIFLPIPFDSDYAGRTVNPDGSVQVGDLVNNGVYTRLQTALRPEVTTDLQKAEEDQFSIGANYETTLGAWDLAADMSYARATGDLAFDRVRIDANNGNFLFDTTIGLDGFNITQTNQGGGANTEIGNPANYLISVFDDRIAKNTDEEFAAQFDAKRKIESDFFSSLETGFRVRTRSKDIERGDNGNGINVIDNGLTLADVGAFNQPFSDFLNNEYRSSFGYDALVFPNNAAARAALSTVDTNVSANPFGSFDVSEKTYATYAQLNINGAIGDIKVRGDIGARFVLTNQQINGFDAEFSIKDNGGQDTTVFDELTTGDATPISFEKDYANFLPALNLQFELDPDLFLRLATSKTLTRPTFNSLAPAFNINANSSTNLNNDNYAVSLTAGNPALTPFESTNFDIGVEWYFNKDGALYASVFHKRIDDFVATVTRNNVTELAGQPIRAIGEEQDGSRAPIAIDQISQPGNQGEAQITGLELGYQQAFEFGFGYLANLTLTKNSAEFKETGAPFDFPGVSDTSFNLTGFYEKGGFEARLSYIYRSDYLIEPSAIGVGGQLFSDDYAQLDASVSYDVTNNLTLFANAINMTNQEQDVFQILPAGQKVFYSNAFTGPRYAFGIRASF